jgi:purine nucleosidase
MFLIRKLARLTLPGWTAVGLMVSAWLWGFASMAQSAPAARAQSAGSKILLDTDIGDDVDDAFALGLALKSREIEILGVTTAWGDTGRRAKIVKRMLAENGRTDIPIAAGVATESKAKFSQGDWGDKATTEGVGADGVALLLETIRKHPSEVTLVAIGPLTNVGAAIDRDAQTFRKLRRVVLMGGSVRRRYGDLGYEPDRGPEPEYNIYSDVAAAKKLFASGVPIFMMPLDSTQLKLDEVKREILFGKKTEMAEELKELTREWAGGTPTLFDAMAVAYAIDPKLCPTTKMRIEIADDGMTKEVNGSPNAEVCLDSDAEKFFRFAMPRWMAATGTKN